MRLNPETRTTKLVWLVNFLRDWYDDRERLEEAERLFQDYREREQSGDGRQALAVVEHLHLLAQSALFTPVTGKVQAIAVQGLLLLREENRFAPDSTADISERLLTEQFAAVEAALDRNPHDAESWNTKAYLLLWEKKECELALQCCNRALELDPHTTAFWGTRSTVFDFLQRHPEALADEDHALSLDPNDPIVWGLRGTTLSNLGRYEDAVTSFTRALELAPHYHRARNKRASLSSHLPFAHFFRGLRGFINHCFFRVYKIELRSATDRFPRHT